MSYTDPNSVHVPGTGAAIPAAWGTTVAADLNDLDTRAKLTKIGEFVAVGATASVSFSSIPATYKHLLVEWSARGDTASTNVAMILQLNGDTTATYDVQLLNSSAGVTTSAATSATGSPQLGFMSAASAPAGYAGGGEISIKNYASTAFHKVAICTTAWETAAAAGQVDVSAVFWHPAAVAAVNALVVKPSAGNFVTGTVVTLYGQN